MSLVKVKITKSINVGDENNYDNSLKGKGWSIEIDENGCSHLVVDYLRVRISEAVGEQVYQQSRAIDGELWLTSTGKVKAIIQ